MIYKSESGDLRMFLTGDSMPSRRLTPFTETDYLALVELTRNADVAFTNLETTVRNRDEGSPTFTVGTPMTTPPALLEDLKWMGFDLVASANNHAADYGTGGVLATVKHLQNARLPYAGSGANLGEARAPGYLDTARGRVGLIAATSFFKPGEQAADQRPDAAGRPGLNPIRFSNRYTVDGAALDTLAKISDGLGLSAERARHRSQFFSAKEAPEDSLDEVSFLGQTFHRGTGMTVETSVNKEDAEAILRTIREAKRQADWVLFSFHNHEFGGPTRISAKSRVDVEEPASFMVDFARAAIDAGADAVAGHGPHVTLGVEIYKNRPIFYSLGNYIFQNDTVEVFPQEAYGRFGLGYDATPADFLDARTGNGTRSFPAENQYWESVAAVCDFKGGKLAEVRLHPVDLGFKRPRAQQGRPVLARGEVAKRTLERIQKLSRHHGTEIVIEDETAIVRLPGA